MVRTVPADGARTRAFVEVGTGALGGLHVGLALGIGHVVSPQRGAGPRRVLLGLLIGDAALIDHLLGRSAAAATTPCLDEGRLAGGGGGLGRLQRGHSWGSLSRTATVAPASIR